VAALLAVLPVAPAARAADSNGPSLLFSGFGTLGVVHSSEHKADFTDSLFKPNGAGYSRAWSADVDSKLGAQLTARVTSRLSAVVQVIAEQRYDNSYIPHVEWANLKYAFTPDFSVRVGRMVLPIFYVADSRKIGYANPWVRPPGEVYSLVPVTFIDGVDATYRIHIGEITNSFMVNYGDSDNKIPSAGDAEARQSFGFTDSLERGNFAARLSFQQARVEIESLNALFGAYRRFGAPGAALANRYGVEGKRLQFISAAAIYDAGDWFLMSEGVATTSRYLLRKQKAWYATAGGRIGAFTPYASYAQARADDHASDPGLDSPGAAPLNSALDQALRSVPVQNTISLGGRWDFARNAAFKIQLDHTREGAGSAGTLVNLQPGFQPGGHVNLFSLAVDFVY
jgi:hypothetical protein